MLIQELKNRINSIESIRKITRAMELVATSKLHRVKKNFIQSKQYYDLVMDTYQIFLSSLPKDFSLTNPNTNTNLYIVITSDYGLCGAYNSNILKLVSNVLEPQDELIVIGSKGVNYFHNLNIPILFKLINLNDNLDYNDLNELINLITAKILTKAIKNIMIASTEYINSITFKPTLDKILDFKLSNNPSQKNQNHLNSILEIEPSPEIILIKTLPLFIGAVLFGKILASKISETSMRRMSMENATDNADELINNLSIKYNQARQAIITQEIAEIVNGSESDL